MKKICKNCGWKARDAFFCEHFYGPMSCKDVDANGSCEYFSTPTEKQADQIVGTSIDYAGTMIKTSSYEVIELALNYEKHRRNRRSMMKKLESRLKNLRGKNQ